MKQVTPTTDDHLDEAMETITNLERQTVCKNFLLTLQEIEGQLKSIKGQSAVLKAPPLPDLERVHISIDQCQVRQRKTGAIFSAKSAKFSLLYLEPLP